MRYKVILPVMVMLMAAAAFAQAPGGPGPGPAGPPEQVGPGQPERRWGEPQERPGLRRGWQEEGGPIGPEARELLEQVFVARLSRRLQLSDERTVLMVRQYTEHRERIQALREERARLTDRLRQLVEEEVNEVETGELLGRLEEIDRDLAMARFAIFEQMSADLTPRQRAGLYLLVSDFENELRRWVTQVHRRRFEQDMPPLLEPEPGIEPGMQPPMPPEGGPRFRDDVMRRPGMRGQGRGPLPPQGPGGREPFPPEPQRPEGRPPVPPEPPQPPPPPAQ